MPIKHLILSGGGVRGIATLGTLNYLIKKQIIQMGSIRTFAGSSVGAILSLLMNCGYTPKQLYDIILSLDLKELFDPDIKNLLTHFGFDTGLKFVHKLNELLVKKKIDPSITFIRLYNLTKQKLIVTATSLNEKTPKYFDYITTPHYKVVDVVRASMGVPILFTTVKNRDEHLVDGGMLDNFPLHLFNGVPAHSIIAIKFKKTKEMNNQVPHIIDNLGEVVIASISCLLEEIEYLRSQLSGELYNKSCILIETTGYHMLSFDITRKDKRLLFRMGKQSAKKYINTPNYIKLKLSELPLKIQSNVWKYIHISKLKQIHSEMISGRIE